VAKRNGQRAEGKGQGGEVAAGALEGAAEQAVDRIQVPETVVHDDRIIARGWKKAMRRNAKNREKMRKTAKQNRPEAKKRAGFSAEGA
jgi:hypothetical protein